MCNHHPRHLMTGTTSASELKADLKTYFHGRTRLALSGTSSLWKKRAVECSSSRWEFFSSWGELYAFWTQVGENCPYYTAGYEEARLFTNNAIEIEGPGGIYTKQKSGQELGNF